MNVSLKVFLVCRQCIQSIEVILINWSCIEAAQSDAGKCEMLAYTLL